MPSAALVDAFTRDPFKGNPAGIVLLEKNSRRNAAWMQSVAGELGASETAFVQPEQSGRYRLRWFTPAVEMELCGHATLAAAHWLWQRGESARTVSFDTRSGVLHAARDRSNSLIWLDFPVKPVVDTIQPLGWREAFGSNALEWIGRTAGVHDLHRNCLLVTDAHTLRELKPDFSRVAQLPFGGAIVTAQSDQTDADVLTRYFAPACGVNEDPVTGSAHCTVGWYWAAKLDTGALRAVQVSPRGGELQVHVDDERVRLGGHAVTVAELNLLA